MFPKTTYDGRSAAVHSISQFLSFCVEHGERIKPNHRYFPVYPRNSDGSYLLLQSDCPDALVSSFPRACCLWPSDETLTFGLWYALTSIYLPHLLSFFSAETHHRKVSRWIIWDRATNFLHHFSFFASPTPRLADSTTHTQKHEGALARRVHGGALPSGWPDVGRAVCAVVGCLRVVLYRGRHGRGSATGAGRTLLRWVF